MEIIYFVKVIFGVIAIYVAIETLSKNAMSWRKAKREIKLKNSESLNSIVISNEDALFQAKQYFECFEDKAYRISDYLKGNTDLPITYRPQRIKFIFISFLIIILGFFAVIKSGEIEIEIFQFIPLGHVVIFYFGVFCLGLGFWMLIYILKFFNEKVILEKEEIILLTGKEKTLLKYTNCNLIATPGNGLFQLNLMPNNSELENKLRVVGFIQQKEFRATIISKFIEKGNFYTTTEVIING